MRCFRLLFSALPDDWTGHVVIQQSMSRKWTASLVAVDAYGLGLRPKVAEGMTLATAVEALIAQVGRVDDFVLDPADYQALADIGVALWSDLFPRFPHEVERLLTTLTIDADLHAVLRLALVTPRGDDEPAYALDITPVEVSADFCSPTLAHEQLVCGALDALMSHGASVSRWKK